MQQSSDSGNKDWDADALRNMGLPDVYKKNSPNGYKEGIKYQPGDELTNTKKDYEQWVASVNAMASDLSAKSSHNIPTYPNLTPRSGHSMVKPGPTSTWSSINGTDDQVSDAFMTIGGRVGIQANEETMEQLDHIKEGM